MMAIKQKNRRIDALSDQAEKITIQIEDAVHQFSQTQNKKYRVQFNQLYKINKDIESTRDEITNDIAGLNSQVETYRAKLDEMETRINELNMQEAEAIADIVSSQQLIKLNESLSNYSVNRETQNLESVIDHRDRLKIEADISVEMINEDKFCGLEDEISAIAAESDASDAFAKMLIKEKQKTV